MRTEPVSSPSPPRLHSPRGPIIQQYLADPFAYFYEGRFFIVGTGESDSLPENTRAFPLITSDDTEHWESAGFALVRVDPNFGTSYWAPAVAVTAQGFFLYYSVGFGDKLHHLRVAHSEKPQGPFHDCEVALTNPFFLPFAIDPHPYQDSDGSWYLFYARDFVEANGNQRIGTSIVLDRLLSMTTLAHAERVITRPRFDWQMFERQRAIYGIRVNWHTIEGPCAVRHKEKVYCFYSAGRWENETYGVDYATTTSLRAAWTDHATSAGAQILSTGQYGLLGPGHNSYLYDPIARQDLVVFHAWNQEMTKRQPYLSKISWE